MGHIKEPDGVDLVIKSRPLTKKEEIAISNYIHAYKTRLSGKQPSRKRQRFISTKKQKQIIH